MWKFNTIEAGRRNCNLGNIQTDDGRFMLSLVQCPIPSFHLLILPFYETPNVYCAGVVLFRDHKYYAGQFVWIFGVEECD